MANIPSPIYQSTVDSTQRLYYKPQGSDVITQISNPTELQNLAKQGLVEVNKPYLAYTPPTSPAANVNAANPAGNTPTNTPTSPQMNTEVSPGVFSSSKLSNFYDNQINLLKPQFEAATKALTDTSTALGGLKGPDFQSLYNQSYTTKIAPIDQNISQTTQKLNSLDANIRTLEDAVRAEIGGRASEASIQAEVARRAKPLLLERQGYVDQLSSLQDQRKTAVSDIQQGLGFEQQSFENQSATLKAQRDLAQNTLDAFSNIMEKGALASDKDVDNARALFSTFLTQSPDFLKSLTEDEYKSLQNGIVPYSAISRIGTTTNQQKLTKVVGTAKTGFYEYNPVDGTFKALTPQQAAARGATGTGTGGTGTGGTSYSGGGGSSSTSSGKPSFDEFLAQEIAKASQFAPGVPPSFDMAGLQARYDVLYPQRLTGSYTASERRSIDRAGIANDEAAAAFLAAPAAFKSWFLANVSPEVRRTNTRITPEYLQTQINYYNSAGSGGKVTRYTDANIPKDLRSELLTNIQSGATRTQVINAYPDVSLDYINKLFDTTQK